MKLKLSIIFFALCKIINAQIIAGDSTSPNVYYNNFADISIKSASYIDIDNDGVNDIKFLDVTADCAIEHCSICYNTFYDAVALKSNIEFVASPQVSNSYDTITPNSLIDKNKNWKSGTTGRYFKLKNTSGSEQKTFYAYGGSFLGTKDKYMGVRLINPKDTLYGWILIGANANTVKAFAFNTSLTNAQVDEYKSNVIIYPNPTADYLHIIFKKGQKSNYTFKLTTVTGQTVSYRNVDKNEGANEVIDLTGLAKGVYVLIVTNNENTITKKVIVE